MNIRRTILLLFLVTATACVADNIRTPEQVLTKTIDVGLAILRDTTLDDEGKLAKFDDQLNESCHLDLMAMLALGRNNWVKFTPDQHQEFTRAYTDLIKRSYYGKISQQDPSKVDVTYLGEEETGSRTKRSLTALMKNGDSRLQVVYKFAFRDQKWGIYDVEIEGISLTVSYRSQFSDFLAKHSPEELLKELSNGGANFKPAGGKALSKGGN